MDPTYFDPLTQRQGTLAHHTVYICIYAVNTYNRMVCIISGKQLLRVGEIALEKRID